LLPNATNLGRIYGESVTADDLVTEVFEDGAAAGKKRRGLASQERAASNGGSDQGKGSLSRGESGSL
jgi:hypothetical protein